MGPVVTDTAVPGPQDGKEETPGQDREVGLRIRGVWDRWEGRKEEGGGRRGEMECGIDKEWGFWDVGFLMTQQVSLITTPQVIPSPTSREMTENGISRIFMGE